MPLLEWIESTWLSTALRDSPNLFLYPTILACHTLGLAFLVGISSAISLRILGVAPSLPLAPLKKFFPIMWIGFWLNAASGLLLLLVEPTRFLTMLDFYLKLLAIAGAVVSMRLLYTGLFRDANSPDRGGRADATLVTTGHKALAGTALALWGAAITAGRLTAYDTVQAQTQTALATFVVSALMLLIFYIVVLLFGRTLSEKRG